MASALKLFTCLVLTVYIAASVDASISCNAVASCIAPCVPYLRQGGVVTPACCGGMRNLNGLAQTTLDRQQACKCVQSIISSIPGLNPNLAAGLPGRCGVSFPYPISASNNCDSYGSSCENDFAFVLLCESRPPVVHKRRRF
ncbi:non-specific lipid-transfer protein 3 isoform X1 [Raphanus sativus]|uniref:Non-specific lipid-transfer protein n=1 Tax=Raphanus sativus TaxID=3726 RepID=A0A9W3DBL9_RAPSA|nr:non-specific lipid-transfer protein 3 isoform X1 [Raphanus sativus]